MFCRNAVRFFSFGKKKKGKEKLKDKLRKKFNELFYPERCKPVPVPKLHLDTCAVNPDWRKPRVVIVGGGIAGLSAAQRLLQCGIDNFVILEGTNRPGGRIHSRWMGDCMTELGALWIEGASISNLIFLLAVQEGLLSPPLKRFRTGQNTTFFTSDGRSIDKRISDIAVSTFKDLIETKASADKALSKHKSLGVYLDHMLAKELERFPCGQQDDMASVMGCLYNELKSRIGQDLCRVRVKALREMQKLPGGNVRIPLGFGSVLAPLLRTLPPCSIIYCKPVHYIVWGESSPNSRATVVCTDKDEFPADYVVLTLPLGVLKNYLTTMFVPPLPKTKVRAINRIGVADVERIFVQYEQPFWGGEAGIGLGWKFNEIHGSVEEWWRGLGELTAVPGSNVILQGMLSGKEATAMCGIPREQLIEDVGNLLRKFTGDPSLSNPFDVQHSNWAQDPFFYGAYSFLELASRPQLIREMAEPIPLANEKKDDCHTKHLPKKPSSPPIDQPLAPIVLFAGEATSVLNFSTVHGARESGIREAQRIIKLTKLCKGPPACKTPCPPCKTK